MRDGGHRDPAPEPVRLILDGFGKFVSQVQWLVKSVRDGLLSGLAKCHLKYYYTKLIATVLVPALYLHHTIRVTLYHFLDFNNPEFTIVNQTRYILIKPKPTY